jgi:hypothetical protein
VKRLRPAQLAALREARELGYASIPVYTGMTLVSALQDLASSGASGLADPTKTAASPTTRGAV